jgi:hypothetical protein
MLKFFDADADPGSGIFLTLDPGWKNFNPGTGINIPDPQHWTKTCFSSENVFVTPSVVLLSSVGDPDPQEPHVFGPPRPGSIRQRYGSGSFPFLIRVLRGLKYRKLNFCKELNF